MKIALLQLLPAGSESENRKKGAEWCRRAKEAGADIALFPEMWSCGYSFPRDVDALRAAAIAADGDFVNSFGELAARLQMAVGITFLEQYEPSPRNSFVLFDRFGRRVLSYAKVHTCDFGEERILTAGNCFPVSELDTAEGKVKVGAMICYDREFPESARILMLEGAELILVPNACPMEINRLSQLRGRAYENMCAIGLQRAFHCVRRRGVSPGRGGSARYLPFGGARGGRRVPCRAGFGALAGISAERSARQRLPPPAPV